MPTPAEPKAPSTLPHPLTFFLTREERRRVLAALNCPAPERTQALLRALGLTQSLVPSPQPLPPQKGTP